MQSLLELELSINEVMLHLVVAIVFRHHRIVVREEAAGKDLSLTSNAFVDELSLAKPTFERAISLLVLFNTVDQLWLELLCESINQLILGRLKMDILLFFTRRVTTNRTLRKRRLGILDFFELFFKLNSLTSHLGWNLMEVASIVSSDVPLGPTGLLLFVFWSRLRCRLSFELLILDLHVEL